MVGAFLNAVGILLGGQFGLVRREPLSVRTQVIFRNALGVFTVFFALRLVWLSVSGTFLSCLKQLFVAALAIVGRLASKKTVEPSAGTLPVHGWTFGLTLTGVIVVVAALTFFPALCLGPLIEHGLMQAGRVF